MITLSATAERALRMIAKVEHTPRTTRCKAPTFVDFANLRRLGLAEFRNGAAGMTWSDLEATAAGRQWLSPKLTPTQRGALAKFAGVYIDAPKPKAATYARLCALGLLEKSGAFPYHKPTDAGREWLALNVLCPACSNPRGRHKRDCVIAMDEQVRKIEAEAPRSACSGCSKSLLFIHERWLGADGSQTCIGLDPHTPTTVFRSPSNA